MAHDHAHHHHSVDPAMAAGKTFVIGIILNLAYVVAEAVAGFWTHSLALISDAGHNLSDVATLALSLLAFRLAKMKPTSTYTYGYKKTTILSALINAAFLLITIGILGFEAVSRLSHPEAMDGSVIAWVSGLGVIINGLSAFLFFKHKDNELNSRGAYLHLLSDMLVSVGVVAAGIIISYTHWYWLDPAVSLIILLVILIGTWSLLTDSLRLSLDAVPKEIDTREIVQVIAGVAGVVSIHHLHIWALSTTENALTVHVVLNSSLSFPEKTKAVHEIKHQLAHHNLSHSTIEIEVPERPCIDEDC